MHASVFVFVCVWGGGGVCICDSVPICLRLTICVCRCVSVRVSLYAGVCLFACPTCSGCVWGRYREAFQAAVALTGNRSVYSWKQDQSMLSISTSTCFLFIVCCFLSPLFHYNYRSVCLNGINAAVTDVECLNCWNAVRAVQAHRHYIARIQGQPINMVRNCLGSPVGFREQIFKFCRHF